MRFIIPIIMGFTLSSNILLSKNILAVGDSHTSGYYQSGKQSAPYTNIIHQNIIKFGSTVQNIARPGAQLAEITEQVQRELSSKKYDLVIVMGGTNDLAKGIPLSEMQSHILTIVQIATKTSTPILLMGIPDFCWFDPAIEEKREQFRAFLEGLANSDSIEFIDTQSHLPYCDLSYWDDLTHWSPKGSQFIGNLILNSTLIKSKILHDPRSE